MTLTPADISAVADAVFARLKAAGATLETTPKEALPPYVTQAWLARRLGRSPSTICERVKRGAIEVNVDGMIPAHEVRRLIAKQKPRI